jgi:DNA-binding response OmpR family regulator
MSDVLTRVTDTALVIDPDLAFLISLCQTLTGADYQVVPATGFQEAVSLISQLGVGVDVAIIDAALLPLGKPYLMGIRAPLNPPPKVIATTRDFGPLGRDVGAHTGVEAVLPRQTPRGEWLHTLRMVLRETPSSVG